MISQSKLLFVIASLLFSIHSITYSQTYNHTTTSTTTSCSGTFYDAGGTGNYGNSITVTQTFYPSSSSNKLKFTFTSFSTENNYDGLMIYNGNSTAAPLISSGLTAGSNATTCPAGSWRGTGSPGTITSSAADGSLTFVFRADANTVSSGWTATVECIGCEFAAEGAQISSAASGCTAATALLGSGAYRDILLSANTYYDFSWANNSGGTTNGYCGRVISGGAGATSSAFSGTVNNWFSGTTAPVVRISASRSSSTWSATSATLTYKHTTPTLGTPSNSGPINFCSAAGDFLTAVTVSGSANGTVVWDWGSNNGVWNNNWVNTTSGTAYFYKKLSNSDGNADRMRYRVSNNGCDVTSATILNTNKYNEAPTSLASSTASFCSSSPPANITLTATFPANINKNGVVAFYSGSCGGTLVGSVTAGDNTTTAAVTIATPGSTTTYYARYEPGTGTSCSNTACASTTVTIGSPSTAPTGVAGAGVTICHGNSVSLSQSGGALSTGASYEWFSASCGGTSAGTGTSISVSPTATTTYYVRASAGTYCPASACASGTITLPTAGSSLATNGQSATCNVSGSNWIHFYTSGGSLIASINPNGNNLGSVTATAYVSGSPVMTQACGTGSNPSFTTAALGRTWVITPTNNLPASVRFPFGTTELSSLIAATASTTANSLDDISLIGNLKMSHYSGVNQNASWADNCVSAGGSGGTQLVGTQAGNGVTNIANGFMANFATSSYVQFNTPGFSEFWLHGDGGSSPLPVELTNFSATCNEQYKVDVNWSTASETNSQKFVVQRSRDLESWTYVSDRNASGNSNYKIDYFTEDESPLGGISYYRLVQVDNDGVERIYGPISVNCADAENSMIVFPNPTKGTFTVEVASSENISNAQIQLTDLTGKVITTRSVNIQEGNNQLLFEGIDLQLGTYIVRVVSKSEFKPVRVVVN